VKSLPKKKTISIDGKTVEYITSGTGSPVVVLVNGAGGPIEGWFRVFSGLEKLSTIFAYNRAGIGKSSKPTEPQTGSVLVETLRASLLNAGLKPPYVLVGHSLGGLIANLFARTYPDTVAGVVFLDATAPEDLASMAAYESSLQRFLRRLLERVSGKDPLGEVAHDHYTVSLIERAPAFPNIPVVVVSGGKPAMSWLTPAAALVARAENQRRLAQLSPRGKHVVASKSGHFPQFSQPEIVIEAVRSVLQSREIS